MEYARRKSAYPDYGHCEGCYDVRLSAEKSSNPAVSPWLDWIAFKRDKQIAYKRDTQNV